MHKSLSISPVFGAAVMLAMLVSSIADHDLVAQNREQDQRESKSLADEEAERKRVDALINQFASGSYIDRRVAMEEVFALGKRARNALKHGSNSTNRDIARRSSYILTLLDMGLKPSSSPKRAAKLMRFFSGDDPIKAATLESLLQEDDAPQDVLNLLSLTSQEFQSDWMAENWSMDYIVKDIGTLESDRQSIEEMLFHPVLWRTSTSEILYFALLLGRIDEQFARFNVPEFFNHEDRATRQLNLLVLAKLAIVKGGLKNAESFLAKLDSKTRNELLSNHFVARGEWNSVLKIVDANKAQHGIESTDLQKLLLFRWLNREEDYSGLLDSVVENVDQETPEDVRRAVDLLIGNLEIDKAEALFKHDQVAEIFSLLCYLNRYRQAFEQLGWGDSEEENLKWYQAETRKLRANYEDLAQRFDRFKFEQVNQQFKLLSTVAYYEGSLGNREKSRRLFDLLADSEIDKNYRSQNRRTVLFGQIVRLGDRDYAWRFIEQRYPETDQRLALSNLFGEQGESVLAGFWFDLLKDDIEDPYDRLREVARIMNSNMADEKVSRLNEWIALAFRKLPPDSPLATRGLRLTYVAETLLKNGRDEEALQMLWESVECGKDASTMTLGSYYIDREEWPQAAKWMRMHFEQTADPEMQLHWAIFKNKFDPVAGFEALRVRVLVHLMANYMDGNLLARLNRFRQHESLIRILDTRLKAEQFSLGNEYLLQSAIHSKSELDPASVGNLPQVMYYNIAARDIPSTNRLIHAEQARETEMSRVRQYLQQRQIDDAWKLAQNIAKFNPGDSSLAEEFVPAFEKAGRKDLADELFDKVASHYESLLNRYPNSALHHNNYAWICAKCNRRFDKSLQHANRAVALRPANSSYLDTLAEVHFLNGDKDRAIELVKECIKISPAKIHYRRQLKRFENGSR